MDKGKRKKEFTKNIFLIRVFPAIYALYNKDRK